MNEPVQFIAQVSESFLLTSLSDGDENPVFGPPIPHAVSLTEAFQCRDDLAGNGKHNARLLAGQLIEELDFLPDEDGDGL